LIAYVSNLPKDLRSGGFAAMNVAAYTTLTEVEPTGYFGPVSPDVILWDRCLSKLRRMVGLQGNFPSFSANRLLAISRQLQAAWSHGARLAFFHGFTPWILFRPNMPYVTWSDCTFRDYINIFHRPGMFRPADIARIEDTEADWLKASEHVVFTSAWAARRAVLDYGLPAHKVSSVGIFGELEPSHGDSYAGGRHFVFVSTDFEAKGGIVALAAFRRVRQQHPDASLVVVGTPPRVPTPEPGVTYTGFLRKESSEEYRTFVQILGNARALVHPTNADICPVLLVEAAYLGCPVISVRKFAIPEVVCDGQTGLLLSDPMDPEAVALAMCWMLEDDGKYMTMRAAARENAELRHSKACFRSRLSGVVRGVLRG
jgi:glycosyltransferase involved in cell wall biosynthesis